MKLNPDEFPSWDEHLAPDEFSGIRLYKLIGEIAVAVICVGIFSFFLFRSLT